MDHYLCIRTHNLFPDFGHRWSLLGGRRRKKQSSAAKSTTTTTSSSQATRLFMCNLCEVAFLENAFLLSHHRIKGRIHKSSLYSLNLDLGLRILSPMINLQNSGPNRDRNPTKLTNEKPLSYSTPPTPSYGRGTAAGRAQPSSSRTAS